MVSKKYYSMNRDHYLQYQKDLYNKNKEEFKERARIRYNNLSPEKKKKKKNIKGLHILKFAM